MGLAWAGAGVILRRLALAATLSAAVTALAAQAALVTRTSALVSLVVEPFSLLLLPGVAIAMVIAAPRDFSPTAAVTASVILYAVLLYLFLHWRHPGPRRSAGREPRRKSR